VALMGCVPTHRKIPLKDVVIQVMFEMLWKKMGKIIERLGKLIEL
jgi:hypothetical protein